MLDRFKKRWDINKSWQLIYPVLGLLGLLYSSYKITSLLDLESIILVVLIIIILTILFTIATLFIFKKLENKWVVERRWEMIRIFIVFALTGSSSVVVSRYIMVLLDFTKENLNIFLYYILYIFVSLLAYQFLLVLFGWALGQFNFFWQFEKKMLRRMGLKRLID